MISNGTCNVAWIVHRIMAFTELTMDLRINVVTVTHKGDHGKRQNYLVERF